MFKKIMLTLDGSTLSETAIPCAVALAKRFRANMIVMEVVPSVDGLSPFSIQGRRAADTRDARAHLEAAAEQLRPVAKAVELHIAEGEAGEEIVNWAESQGCDAIVMSTHGRSGLRHVLLGSVADHVVRHGRGAVVVLVRPTAQELSTAAEQASTVARVSS